MVRFEAEAWTRFGQKYVNKEDRRMVNIFNLIELIDWFNPKSVVIFSNFLNKFFLFIYFGLFYSIMIGILKERTSMIAMFLRKEVIDSRFVFSPM